MWRNSDEHTVKTNIDLLVAYHTSSLRLLCAADTWTVKITDSRKLVAFEIRCYGRILEVCWKDKFGNKIVREKVENIALNLI